MPSKGKRIASRQSSLRRRRGNAGSRPAPVTAAGIAAANGPDDAVPGGGTMTATATAAATATAPAPAAAPAARPAPGPGSQPQRGRRFERPAAYNYVGSELRNIGILSAVMLAALIAISFVI